MGPPTRASRAKGATANQKDTKELIKMLKTSLKEKEETNQRLMKEIGDLKRQMAILLDKITTNLGNNKPSDSSSEDKGLTSTEEEMDDDRSSVQSNESMETVIDASEKEAEFQPVKNRKARREERFSSDEESAPKRAQTQSMSPSDSPVRSPIRTPDKVPAKKAKKTRIETGKTDPINNKVSPIVDNVNFPPLPPPKPAAGNSAAPITKGNVASPTPQVPQITKRPPRPKQIPPIVISNAGKFVSISSLLREHKIHYTSAAVQRNGIKIFPATEQDYRKATALLDQHKEPYFTFRFPEEKLNHIVLRGVPTHLTNEEIAENLSLQGFSPKKIIRWFYSNGNPMPMTLVLLPKSEVNIYKVRLVCNFEVRAEAQKSKARGIQCYNCQDHGHAAPCCHVPARCVKCGENHHTSKCTKSRDVPAKCANCAGDHPASFSGCPRHPSQIKPKQSHFKGWGKTDHSGLASNKTQEQLAQPTPAPTSVEAPLSATQIAQFTQLIQDQLKPLMTIITSIKQA